MASAAGLTTAQTWISGLGDAASFVLLISPACTFLRVKRTGLIGNVDVMPFIFTFFNCLMLVANAIPDIHHSKPILIINSLGSFLELIWIVLFIYYSDGTKRAVAIGSLIVTTVISIIVFTLVFTKVKQNKWSPTFLGYLAAASGVAMYTLPIRSTWRMVRLNDGGDLNLIMILASLANGGLWSAFAKVGRRSVNWFLMVPNATAILCASGQLIVWVCLFMNKPPVLPVVAPNQGGAVSPAQNQGGAALPAQNQEGAVGLQQGEGSRAGENLSQRQQPEGLRTGPSPGALASSSAVVTDLEMAIRSGSPNRSNPGSGASSKSVSDSLSRSVSRSPTRSGTLTQSKPGSPSGSRSPTRCGTRSPSGSHSPTRSGTRSKSGSPSGSQSGSRAPSNPVSPSVPRSPSRSSSASDTQQPLVPPSSLPPSPAETHDDNTD